MSVFPPKISDIAATLRGSLKKSSLDARQVTLMARNSPCKRLRAIVIAGLKPLSVANEVFQANEKEKRSEFAIIQGNSFERRQMQNGAARFLTSLQEAGLLDPHDVRVRNLNHEIGENLRDPIVRQKALKATDRILHQKAQKHPYAPNVVIQPCLRLKLSDDEDTIVRPDALVARSNEPMYHIAELKSFPDFKHLTDEKDVATTAAQAGVYGAALEDALQRLDIKLTVPREAILTFKKPGSLNSTSYPHRIDREIDIAQRMLAQRSHTLLEVESLIGKGQSLDEKENVMKVPANFCGSCRSFCPMWRICHEEGRTQNNPAILGAQVEQLVTPLNDINRAIALMDGATPQTPEEQDLQYQLQMLDHELRRAS